MRRGYLGLLAAIGAWNAVDAEAADIKILSTPTLKAALNELSGPYEHATGDKLLLEFDGVPVLKRRIESGEAFDVALLLASVIEDLAKEGKLTRGAPAEIARTA